MGLVAAIAGASGLVGAQVLAGLLADPAYQRIVSVSRRPLPDGQDKTTKQTKLTQVVGDLAAIDAATLGPVDIVFCCLGTTIKTAGSRAAFRLVDYEFPMRLGAAGLVSGAEHFLLVSAAGAHPSASAFYSRVKGELERDLRPIGYRSLSIFSPGLLLGERSEHRPGERFAQALLPPLNPLLLGPLRKFRAIQAATVARAMVNRGRQSQPGTRTFHCDDIEALALGPAQAPGSGAI